MNDINWIIEVITSLFNNGLINDLIFFAGGNVTFDNYDDLEGAYASEKIHPGDLKSAVEVYINKLLDPIRKEFEKDSKFKELSSKAYPPPQKEKKQQPQSKVNKQYNAVFIGITFYSEILM